MDVPVDYHVWGAMLKHSQNTHAKAGQRNAEIKDHFVDETEWFFSRVHWYDNCIILPTDFDRVLLPLVGTDIENSLFKYRVSYRHQTFIIETFKLLMKSCKNLICYLCIFNVQLHDHLKKWTLKFKLLYLRNYASYFNKICRISCVNTPYSSDRNSCFWQCRSRYAASTVADIVRS